MITLKETTDETLEFEITSSSRDSTHSVYYDESDGWLCTCEQCYYRKCECKHIRACKEFLTKNNYTIVGVTVKTVLEYNPVLINHIINMGCFYDIKNQREEEAELWNSQQEPKLKV